MSAILICVLTIVMVTKLEVDAKCDCTHIDECTKHFIPGSKYQEKFKDACKFLNVCLCCGSLYDWSKVKCDTEFKLQITVICNRRHECMEAAEVMCEKVTEHLTACCKRESVREILERL